MLYFDPRQARLLSGAKDGTLKLWDVSLESRKSNVISSDLKEMNQISARLNCITIISMDRFDSIPNMSYAWCAPTMKMGIPCHGELFLTTLSESRTVSYIHI
jgi:hypothetical protein